MAYCFMWISLTILIRLLTCASLDIRRKEKESVYKLPHRFSYSGIWWHPHYSLKEYQSFRDAKVYVLNVPEYTSKMRLSFVYQGMYSHSHEPCNNSITVLLQHGSPAIPYKDKIHTESWLYNNTEHCKKTVSLDQTQDENISSPLPGEWYVTAFLPHVDRVEKIKEKGLSTPDERCLSALLVIQVLLNPLKPAVVLAKGQPWKSAANVRFPTSKYYQYFVSSYSRNLLVQLNNSCNGLQNCSLELSLSAKRLPTSSSLSCIAPCVLEVNWPQPQSWYYIEVSGTSHSYEITASHTECRSEISGCSEIVTMSSMVRKLLTNSWSFYLLNDTSTFSLELTSDYVGTTLTFLLWPFHARITSATYKMCIMKDILPSVVLKSNKTSIYCSEKNDGVLRMQVVFPQSGTWYITVDIKSHEPVSFTPFVFHAKTRACLSECEKHGSCVIKSDIGISYGSCVCDYGYSGFLCSDYHSLDVLAVCLLTISNIAFVPGIVVACSRKFYPEAIVYLFNMYCSTVYHACDSHGYCIYDYDTLQLSDFFASVLSVWFTLVTMVKLPALWHRTLNILAICCLFVGTQLSRFGLLIIAIPGGVGLLIVLISFGCRSYNRRKCFPRPKRWLFFLLPAFVLASTAVGIFTGLETTANYKYLHSIWHIAIASCIPLLLPSVRKPTLYVDYNMVGQINDDESFRDSDESLLLNVRNVADHNDTHEDTETEETPRLIT